MKTAPLPKLTPSRSEIPMNRQKSKVELEELPTQQLGPFPWLVVASVEKNDLFLYHFVRKSSY